MNSVNRQQGAVRQDGGFTLIELMVALVIISVSLLALGAFTLAVLSSDNEARQRTVATHIAEQELEKWFASDTAPAQTTTYTVNNTKYQLQSFDVTPVSGVYTSTLSGANYDSEVRAITVYWKLKGKQKSVTVTHIQRAQ